MDEKDFSLDSRGSGSTSNDELKTFGEDDDISFGAPSRNSRRSFPADETSEEPAAAEDTEDYEQAEDEPAEEDIGPADGGVQTDDAEEESAPAEEEYAQDGAYADTDTDTYTEEGYEEDGAEAADESADEITDEAEYEDNGAEPAEENAEAEVTELSEYAQNEQLAAEEEADLVLAPSSTNGVTDFSEDMPRPRQVRRSSGAAGSAKNKKKKKKKKRSRVNNSIFGALILVTVILTVSLVVAITGIKIGMEYLGVGKSEDDITFNIPENATADDICEMLISNNIIENRTLFKIAMKLQHSPTLFPGDVTLHPSMGYSTIIETLSTQRDIRKTVTITFKEGITLLEAANMLEEQKVCTAQDFLFEFNKDQGFSFESMIDESADTFYKMEGFFFPDTYEFYVNDSGYNVTRTIKSNFASKFTDQMMKTMEKNKMTLSELMTLASIVQWEANSAGDMPKVASVFINRLADPDTFPKLQSDATGNYLKKVVNVVGDTASKEHYADLYDTYVCSGLPAGPVCNPGLDAIMAVLEPEKTEYYYFCNNLKTGKSFFAKTLEEHEKNLVKAGLA